MEFKMAQKTELPNSLKIVAIYFILAGMISLIWPMLNIGPHHQEFQVQSTAYKTGVYTREIVINLIFIISGGGIFFRMSAARKSGLTILVISSYYSVAPFARGFANGKPSLNTYLISFVLVGAWNAIWFYQLYKKSSAEALFIKLRTK